MRRLAARLRSTIVIYSVHDEATLIWAIGASGEPTHVRVPVGRDRIADMVAATTAAFRQAFRASTAATRGEDRATSASVPAADDLTALPMRGLSVLALSRDDKAGWRELHKILIAPIGRALPASGGRLTVVPHGALFQLSFGALQAPNGRYLIEDYELHYAPAASALEYTGLRQEQVAARTDGPWAIVGNPSQLPSIGGRPLPALPGASREIGAIASLAPGGHAIRLSGSAADEAGLVRALASARPRVLHFATHGFVFEDATRPPFLALNRRSAASSEDGMLTADEVYDLDLETDLVVLSACRTGGGQISSDGIVGLMRGFMSAGSPSVMATFWDVTDEATSILMTSFYRGYVRSSAKGASLRAAQLALLRDLRAGKVVVTAGSRRVTLPEHPLLWAAFFLTGEP
jgi:CHAT domain-containing protein